MSTERDLDREGMVIAEQWLRDLREERARKPGRSVLFPKLGDARMRRQVVRWMGREYTQATPGILETLRTALDDEEWEVRVSAMLVAARLRASELRSAVKETALPSPNQFGLSEGDVRLLVAARVIATEALNCAESGDATRDATDDAALVACVCERLSDVPRELVRRIVGVGDTPRTSGELLLHALVTPVELEEPLPAELPAAVVRRDRRLSLAGVIDLVWVSPMPHLLGDALSRAGASGSSSIREYTPASGFFIARRPLSASALFAFGIVALLSDDVRVDADIAARVAATPDAPLVVAYPDALALCDAIAALTGAVVMLPTDSELECASRGSDGRRYSWGNGLERLDGWERSPHGVERFAVPVAQWTSTCDATGKPIAMGGPTAVRCSERLLGAEAGAVRVVVRMV